MLRLKYLREKPNSCDSCVFFSCFYCSHKQVCKYAFLRVPGECEYFECNVKVCRRKILEDAIFLCFDSRSYDIVLTSLECSSYCVHYFINEFDKRFVIRAIYASNVHMTRILGLLKHLPIIILPEQMVIQNAP